MKENNKLNLGLENIWEVVCYDSSGAEKWREVNENLVTTEGLNDILTKYLKGSSYTATWYVGLAGAGLGGALSILACRIRKIKQQQEGGGAVVTSPGGTISLQRPPQRTNWSKNTSWDNLIG